MKTSASSVERLMASREQLRGALNGASASATDDPMAPSNAPWLEGLKGLPGVAVVLEAVHQWWTHHPLRGTALVALGSVEVMVRPLARRHPLGLVAVGLLLGVAVVACRPWRWGLKPALFAGLLPQLMLASLTQVQRKAEPPTQTR